MPNLKFIPFFIFFGFLTKQTDIKHNLDLKKIYMQIINNRLTEEFKKRVRESSRSTFREREREIPVGGDGRL